MTGGAIVHFASGKLRLCHLLQRCNVLSVKQLTVFLHHFESLTYWALLTTSFDVKYPEKNIFLKTECLECMLSALKRKQQKHYESG